MFRIGNKYSAFYCQVGLNDLHKNLALMIIFSKNDDVTVIDKFGTRHTEKAFLINPMVEHAVVSSSPIWCIFLAPYSAFVASLKEFANDSGISTPPSGALPFHNGMSDQQIFEVLDEVMVKPNLSIDPRLTAVLEDLSETGSQLSLIEIAAKHGVSAARLRVIAKEQLGMPLSGFQVWQKLITSMKAMSLGSSLSEAAHIGGFSDQAHFTRTIRKMFGKTPSNTLQAFD